MQARADRSSELRKALGQFATGIAVVTARAPDGLPCGLTINSFTSVSLQPPLVLWCLALDSTCYDVLRNAERTLINVLAADQLELAKRFAARGGDKFEGIDWQPTDTGLPRLDGCIAWFECAARGRHEEGDHVILVGRVDSFQTAAGRPLIFHNSRYVSELTETLLPRGLRAPLG